MKHNLFVNLVSVDFFLKQTLHILHFTISHIEVALKSNAKHRNYFHIATYVLTGYHQDKVPQNNVNM